MHLRPQRAIDMTDDELVQIITQAKADRGEVTDTIRTPQPPISLSD